jgi:hypothetical protein
MGVAHGDELQYLFSGIWGEEMEMSASDTKFTRNIFTPLLANFAKTRCQSCSKLCFFFKEHFTYITA